MGQGAGIEDFLGTAPTGGGPSGPPPGGGGPATGTFAQSSQVPHWDQWLTEKVIWMGHQTQGSRKSKAKPGTDIPVKGGFRTPVYGTALQFLMAFRDMNNAEFQKFKNQLVAAGFVSKDADPVTVEESVRGILNDVYSANKMGAKLSPQQYINSMIRKNGLDPKKIPNDKDWDPAAELAAAQFQPSTSKVTSVYDLDPADAEDLLTQTLSGVLGRDPSKAEIEDFVDAVKARALANPTSVVTKTRRGDLSGQAGPGTQVQVTSQGGETFSTVTSVDEGFDEQDMARIAERRAKAAPDYASSQAVSTYYPALLSALGATV